MSSVPTAFAGDTWPWEGDAATKPNQPHVVGQRVYDLEFWGEDTEEGADLLTAKVPIQQRNDAFSATQANPDLNYDAEIFNMQGDYGNSFFEATPYNNEFSQYLFNYWQYTDYYASWHGVTTKGAPMSQYDPDGAWQQRYFEFGLINMPNPAYTNAAHKNGAKSIGCIFLPRAGQTHASMIAKDENGEFPIAKKLIQFANYYGFDGYFINQEESIPSTDVPIYKEFTKFLIENGIYVQWYDSITPSGGLSYQNRLNASNSTFIHDDKYGLGKVNSSLFVNYDWFRSNYLQTSFDHAAERNIDLFSEVFFGVECNQGKLSGSHGSASNINMIYAPGTKNLRGSVALFTPSDWIQLALDGDLYGSDNPNKRAEDGYQWMIAERERMFYSGVAQDPTNTGKLSGYQNPTIGVNNAGGWVGVADFAAERSVINGTTFYTNFNTGHGMEYYQNGQVANENEWSNMNIQDILPSWQWWLETEGTKLNVDFDYGSKYQKLDKNGNDLGVGYTQVGAYNGGSSLVVNGTLDAENFLRLYKTDLSVNENSKISVTYNKASADDASSMEIGIIFKNSPDSVYTINVPNSGKQTDGWVTKNVSLDPEYVGEEIAAIGINFKNNNQTIENYQMNIGELKVTDGSVAKPATPTNFKVSKAYDTDEMIVTWDIADYNQVKQYNLYANLSDGSRVYLGGTYDDTYYIKSLYGEKDIVNLELKAVAEDGTESDAATTSYKYSDKVTNIQVNESNVENGNKLQNNTLGYMELSWENPAVDYEAIEITVTPAKYWDYKVRNEVYTKTVAKGVTSTWLETPIADGSSYTLTMQVVYADGAKGEPILYTGHFKDVYVETYDEAITSNGNSITFTIPTSEDWWHMYAYVDGKPLTFRSEYDTNKQFAIRGKSFIHNVTVPSSKGVVEVILEDYSGNLSEPAYIPYGYTDADMVDAKMFPDEALLNAVKEQIGETANEVFAFDGTLDLSGTAVKNLTGINNLMNLTGLNISNCTELTIIGENVFSALRNLKEIDITGCSNLQVLNINNSTVEKLTYGDATAFENMIALNLSGSKFDLSAGTPERIFVDQIDSQADESKNIVTVDPAESNLALNAAIVAGQTNANNASRLVDGNKSQYISFGVGKKITIDLGAEQEITSWTLVNDTSSWGLADFEIKASNDGENYTTIVNVTGNNQVTVSGAIDAPAAYRYYQLVPNKNFSSGGDVRELELNGHKTIVIESKVSYDNQKPAGYYDIPEAYRVDMNNNGKTLDMNEYFNGQAVSVRGNSLTEVLNQDFVAEGYTLADAASGSPIHYIRTVDSQGNVTRGTIETNKDGVYTVEYITYDDIALNGKVVYTQTVYVRGVTAVLEAVIEKAEQLLADGALENTMEAVVTEFNAALEAAKEIVAGDGASQAEINAATVRLLNVMAKVDWKQGDKTVLQVAVDVANAIKVDIDLYVEAGKQEFLDALARGEELLASGNAWDDEIQAATDALIEAMSNLRMAANKDILNDMINKANSVDFSAYTVESANAVRAALNAAEALAADANATQDAVDAAANTLKAALNGLVVVNGNNPADDANNNGNDNAGTTTPVGDGSAPTQTGDAGAAGFAGLAILSAAGVLFALKSKKRD